MHNLYHRALRSCVGNFESLYPLCNKSYVEPCHWSLISLTFAIFRYIIFVIIFGSDSFDSLNLTHDRHSDTVVGKTDPQVSHVWLLPSGSGCPLPTGMHKVPTWQWSKRLRFHSQGSLRWWGRGRCAWQGMPKCRGWLNRTRHMVMSCKCSLYLQQWWWWGKYTEAMD